MLFQTRSIEIALYGPERKALRCSRSEKSGVASYGTLVLRWRESRLCRPTNFNTGFANLRIRCGECRTLNTELEKCHSSNVSSETPSHFAVAVRSWKMRTCIEEP